jgi:hypothetical protein
MLAFRLHLSGQAAIFSRAVVSGWYIAFILSRRRTIGGPRWDDDDRQRSQSTEESFVMRIAAGLFVPAIAAGLFFVPMTTDIVHAGGKAGGMHAAGGHGMKPMRGKGMRGQRMGMHGGQMKHGVRMRGQRMGMNGGEMKHGVRMRGKRMGMNGGHMNGGGRKSGAGMMAGGHRGAMNTGSGAYAQARAKALREFRQMRRETVRELRQAGVTHISRAMERDLARQALDRLQTSAGAAFTPSEVAEVNRRVARAVARYNDGGGRGGYGMGKGGNGGYGMGRGGRGGNVAVNTNNVINNSIVNNQVSISSSVSIASGGGFYAGPSAYYGGSYAYAGAAAGAAAGAYASGGGYVVDGGYGGGAVVVDYRCTVDGVPVRSVSQCKKVHRLAVRGRAMPSPWGPAWRPTSPCPAAVTQPAAAMWSRVAARSASTSMVPVMATSQPAAAMVAATPPAGAMSSMAAWEHPASIATANSPGEPVLLAGAPSAIRQGSRAVFYLRRA